MANGAYVDIRERFLDADKESNKVLLPIEGYEKYPLVSLEEAVQPLKSLVNDLDIMVSISKRNSRKPSDGLTVDESAAIHLYTLQWKKPCASLYTLLNATLRSAHRDNLIVWFAYLKLLLTAMHKLPSIRSTVWRGVSGDRSNDYDDDVVWWGFSSCTETMKVMEHFMGTAGQRTLFTIECTDGKNIRHHSHFEDENEILLMPGAYFRIVDKWSPNQDLWIIHLRQSTPPWQTIALPIESPASNNENISLHELSISKNTIARKDHTKTPKKIIVDRLLKIPANFDYKWRQQGVTVAGGSGPGNSLNQLFHPCGIHMDENRTIYIADTNNDRIIKWRWGASSGEVVAGGNGKGNRSDQLDEPTDLVIDKSTDTMIVCDWGNQRVVRWPLHHGTHGETIFSNIHCSRLSMDDEGCLYVSDYAKNEVKRYGSENFCGDIVAGGNGCGDDLNQLNWPANVFVDGNQAVYVSEINNHRVVKWEKNAKEGITVAGGCGAGNSFTQLCAPRGIIVDQSGSLYIADCLNHRVMRWRKGKTHGDVIVGSNGTGNGASELNFPIALVFDQEGSLYVLEQDNDRVQKFAIVYS